MRDHIERERFGRGRCEKIGTGAGMLTVAGYLLSLAVKSGDSTLIAGAAVVCGGLGLFGAAMLRDGLDTYQDRLAAEARAGAAR